MRSIDSIVFLGSGQHGRITKWVAANTPIGTVVVEGLPHKMADRNAHDLKEFAHRYTSTALLAVLKAFDLDSVHIVAESQAAPGVIWAALDDLRRVKNVALIAPLGFTAHILGSSPKERLKELKRRAFLSAMQLPQSPLYDWRNFYLNSLMLPALLFDTRWRASGQKYAVGASHDLREDCRRLAAGLHRQDNTLTLILGHRDRIFPPAEITEAVEKAGIKYLSITILKTSHTSLATRDGKTTLRKAIAAVR